MNHIEHRSTDQKQALRPIDRAWIRAFAGGRELQPCSLQCFAVRRLGQRDWVDAQAAWSRWHAVDLVARFNDRERPFFNLFDRVRAELLASNGLPGMSSNLANFEQLAPASRLLAPLYLCARHLASGEKDAARIYIRQWTNRHNSQFLKAWPISFLEKLSGLSSARSLNRKQVQALSLILLELFETEAWSQDLLKDANGFVGKIYPLVKHCGERLGRWLQEESLEEETADGASRAALDIDTSQEDINSPLVLEGKAETEAQVARAYTGYAVYSQALDETATAQRWYQTEDRNALMDLQNIDRQRARMLSHRLKRRLEGARRRTWQFDQEEGLIDSRRIARLVHAGCDPRVFRRESECPVPEACVSMLVDMSGSMRHSRRISAALAIDLAVHVLEACGIQCEVLGYTTRYGKDNPIERRWRCSGQLSQPGRLNALRHIIFKSAGQQWRRCRSYLGLLLRDGFGNENIDGEALHWAARRLFSLDVSRRILIVLSDGAPFDQATATANGRDFLCEHLRDVVRRLEKLPLHLVALGTGSDVSRFYRNAAVLKNPEAVAETLFKRLGDLLVNPKSQFDSP